MSTTTRDALPKRFWAKVATPAEPQGCWQWTGSDNGKGYGQYWHEGRMQLAHRVAYTILVDAIPHGLQIDHLCRNRGCVRPDHLDPVTNRVNILRGSLPEVAAAQQSKKTHCPAGHPYSPENTQLRPDGARACRQCNRDRVRARYWAKKAATGASISSMTNARKAASE